MRSSKAVRFLVGCLASFTAFLPVNGPLRAQDASPPLAEPAEPLGDGAILAQLLLEDATAAIASAGGAPLPDPAATALRENRLVDAFAEAFAASDSPDPVLASRGQARIALILARLGSDGHASAYANAALAQPTVAGEVHLARAWIQWTRGRWTEADREADRAAAITDSAAAPPWLLDDWSAFRAAHPDALTAAADLAAAKDGATDPVNPAFLDATAARLRAGAYGLAHEDLFRAIGWGHQLMAANADYAPPLLARAYRLNRDLHSAILGRYTGAAHPEAASVWDLIVRTRRHACDHEAASADWEILLRAYVESLQIPRFDCTAYNIHQDLRVAERDFGLPTTFRDQLKALLDDPRQRYASRLNQAHDRLLADPIQDTVGYFPADLSTIDAPSVAQLDAAIESLRNDEAILERLRAQFPADAPAVAFEKQFRFDAAQLHLTHAIYQGDYAAARAAHATSVALQPEVNGWFNQERVEGILTDLRHEDFIDRCTALLARSEDLAADDAELESLTFEALVCESDLKRTHQGDWDPAALAGPPQRLWRTVLHLRLRANLAQRAIWSAESNLADLIATFADPAAAAADPTIAQLADLVTHAPFNLEFTEEDVFDASDFLLANAALGDDEELLDLLNDEFELDLHFDTLNRALLTAAAQWTANDFEGGDVTMEGIAAAVPRNLAARQALDAVRQHYSPRQNLAAILAEFRAAPPSRRTDETFRLLSVSKQIVDVYITRHGVSVLVDPAPLTPSLRSLLGLALHCQCLGALEQGIFIQAAANFSSLHRFDLPAADLAALRDQIVNFPFTHDLPADAHPSWQRFGVYSVLTPEERQPLFDTFNKTAPNSITARYGQILLLLGSGSWSTAEEIIATIETHFGLNPRVAAQLEPIRATLREAQADLAQTQARINELDLERGRYQGSLIDTLERMGDEDAARAARDQQLGADARHLLNEMRAGNLTLEQAENARQRMNQRASDNWTVYNQRDRDRANAFIITAREKIATYTQEIEREAAGFTYRRKSLPARLAPALGPTAE